MKVTGMTCSGCEAAVKIAAKQIDGVKDAKASYAKGTAEVTYDSAKTSPDAIASVGSRVLSQLWWNRVASIWCSTLTPSPRPC